MKISQIDFNISFLMYEDNSDILDPNLCYNNVYRLIDRYKHFFQDETYKVAYGYWGDELSCLIRHCYIIQNDNSIIDPTIFFNFNPISIRDSKNLKYFTFKVLDLEDYYDLIEGNDLDPDLKNVLKDEESQFIDYAMKERLPIEEWTYNKYLKELDVNNSLLVIDAQI